jgi:hypothetical protein
MYSSSVLIAFSEDRPCPCCALSIDATAEILSIQRTRADDALKVRLTEEIKARAAAELKVRQLEDRLRFIRQAVDADPG